MSAGEPTSVREGVRRERKRESETSAKRNL